MPAHPLSCAPRRSTRSRHRCVCAITAAVTVVAGCRDMPSPAAPDAPPPFAARGAAGELRDAIIDRNDTYFAVEVLTSRAGIPATQAAIRAAGGAASIYSEQSYETLWSSTYVETGYDANGQVRFNVYRNPSSDPALQSPPSLIRVAGNMVEIYDQAGGLVHQEGFSSFMDGNGLPGGSMVHATPAYEPGCDYDASGNPDCDSNDSTFYARVGAPAQEHRMRNGALELVTRLEPPKRVSEGTIGATASRSSTRRAVEVVHRYVQRTLDITDARTGRRTAAPRWLLATREVAHAIERDGRTDTLRTVSTYRYIAAHLHQSNQRERRRRLSDTSRPARPPQPRNANHSLGSSAKVANSSGSACTEVQLPGGGTGRVVWQHGWMSSNDTWCPMRNALNATHQVGLDQAYTTNWKAPIDQQAGDLGNRMANHATPSVLIGHSQGGLIVRSIAQARPELVSGVITVATPHVGAYLASNTRSYIAERMGQAANETIGTLMGGIVQAVLQEIASELLTWGIDQTVPVANDVTPGSGLINRLNSTSEPFPRASIQVSVPPRWAIFRLIGDARTSRSRLGLGLHGETWAGWAEEIYLSAHLLRDLAMHMRWWMQDFGSGWGCWEYYYQSYWPPCYDSSYASYFWAHSFWNTLLIAIEVIADVTISIMNRVDYTWTSLTTRGENFGRTDGFIQYASQVYPDVPGPFTPFRFLAGNRESHAGETASQRVLDRIRELVPAMGVQVKP